MSRDVIAVLALDLVGRRAVLPEPAGDDNTLAVILRPVSFLALVLEGDRDFGLATGVVANEKRVDGTRKTHGLRLAFANKRLKAGSATGGRGLAAQGDGQRGEDGTLTAYTSL